LPDNGIIQDCQIVVVTGYSAKSWITSANSSAAIHQAAAPSLVDPAQPTVKRRDIAVLNRPIGDTPTRLAQGNHDLVGYALFLQNPMPDLACCRTSA